MKVLALPAFKNYSANPFTHLLYSEMVKQGVLVRDFSQQNAIHHHWDIFHVHWPEMLLRRESFFGAVYSLLRYVFLLKILKKNNTKIIWTIHDIHFHESFFPIIEKVYRKIFINNIDGIILLSNKTLEMACESLPSLKQVRSFVIPHGHYKNVYPNNIDKLQARRQLNIPKDAAVLCFFGRVNPYKNILALINKFKKIFRKNTYLIVCGSPISKEFASEIETSCANYDHIKLFLKHIEINDVQIYLNASDLVVLPYKKILNSGSALLALSFDRPILVPDLGGLADLKLQIGDTWIRTYEGDVSELELGEAIKWAVSKARPCQAPLSDLDWPVIANETKSAYLHVLKDAAR